MSGGIRRHSMMASMLTLFVVLGLSLLASFATIASAQEDQASPVVEPPAQPSPDATTTTTPTVEPEFGAAEVSSFAFDQPSYFILPGGSLTATLTIGMNGPTASTSLSTLSIPGITISNVVASPSSGDVTCNASTNSLTITGEAASVASGESTCTLTFTATAALLLIPGQIYFLTAVAGTATISAQILVSTMTASVDQPRYTVAPVIGTEIPVTLTIATGSITPAGTLAIEPPPYMSLSAPLASPTGDANCVASLLPDGTISGTFTALSGLGAGTCAVMFTVTVVSLPPTPGLQVTLNSTIQALLTTIGLETPIAFTIPAGVVAQDDAFTVPYASDPFPATLAGNATGGTGSGYTFTQVTAPRMVSSRSIATASSSTFLLWALREPIVSPTTAPTAGETSAIPQPSPSTSVRHTCPSLPRM